MNVFELMAKISLDKSEYQEGLSDASKEGQGTASKLSNVFGKAGKVAGASMVAMGTATLAVTKKMGDGISTTASYGDHIDKMSQKLGISAEAYQEWDFIAQHCGTTVDGLQTTMKTLSNAVQDGSKDQIEAFEKIGLSMEDVSKMSTEELFENVVRGLQGMEEGTERTALATDLLGKSATELAPLLNQSVADTEAMKQQAHELGAVMSDEVVQASAGFQDSLQNLGTAITGLQNGAFAQLIPAVTEIMDGLTAVFGGDDGGIQQIADGVTQLADKIISELPKFMEIGMQIIEALGKAIISNLPMIIESATKIVTTLVQMIVANLPMLIEVALQIIVAIVKGLISGLPQLADGAKEALTTIKDAFTNAMSNFTEIGKNIVDGLWNGIKNAWSSLTSNVEGKVSGLIGSVKGKLGIHSPSKVFAQIGEYCAEGFEDGAEDLMNTDSILSNLRSGIDSVQGAVSDMSFSGSVNGTSEQNVSVNVTLAGDADGIFRIVRQESQRYYKSTGRQAFA